MNQHLLHRRCVIHDPLNPWPEFSYGLYTRRPRTTKLEYPLFATPSGVSFKLAPTVNPKYKTLEMYVRGSVEQL
jgi:hypothetical protein